jgi:hypothetical protein
MLFQDSVEGLDRRQKLLRRVIEVVISVARNVLDRHCYAGIVGPRVVETERPRFPGVDLFPVHAVRDSPGTRILQLCSASGVACLEWVGPRLSEIQDHYIDG